MAANIQPVGAVRMEGLYSIPIEHATEAASQTFNKGAFLVYSSGRVAQAAANPTKILGISTAKATGITGADCPYIPPVPGNLLYEISCDNAAVGGNAPGTGTPSLLTIGATYGITQDTASGNWYLDYSKSASNQVATVVEYDADQTALINGRVHIRILLANTTY